MSLRTMRDLHLVLLLSALALAPVSGCVGQQPSSKMMPPAVAERAAPSGYPGSPPPIGLCGRRTLPERGPDLGSSLRTNSSSAWATLGLASAAAAFETGVWASRLLYSGLVATGCLFAELPRAVEGVIHSACTLGHEVRFAPRLAAVGDLVTDGDQVALRDLVIVTDHNRAVTVHLSGMRDDGTAELELSGPAYLLCCLLSGELSLTEQGKPFRVTTGDATLDSGTLEVTTDHLTFAARIPVAVVTQLAAADSLEGQFCTNRFTLTSAQREMLTAYVQHQWSWSVGGVPAT